MRFAMQSRSIRARLLSFAALSCIFYGLQLSAQQPEKSPSTDQCGVYAEAYKTGSPGYDAYLKFTNEQAKTRDRNESGKRYSTALQKSAPAANALWLNNWCTKNPLKNYTEASNRLLDELTGQAESTRSATKSGDTPSPIKDSLVIVLGDQAPPPNSCKVGKTQYCSGCSIACNEGEKASCMVGIDSYNGPKCFQSAICHCK